MTRVSILIVGFILSAAPGWQPNAATFAEFNRIGPTRMGVDHVNSLWAWDRPGHRVLTLTMNGASRELHLPSTSGARAIDVDGEWGALVLSNDGTSLQHVRWNGGAEPIHLREAAGSVTWVDRNTAVVATRRASHLLEVWDVSSKSRKATMGQAAAVPSSVGVSRPRLVFARYSYERRVLYAVDSYTGRIAAFGPEGKLLFETTRPHPDIEQYEQYLRQADAEARAAGTRASKVLIRWDGFAVDREGVVWMTESGDKTRGTVRLIGIPTDGKGEERVLTLDGGGCLSYRFVFWGNHYVPYREAAGGVTCAVARRIE